LGTFSGVSLEVVPLLGGLVAVLTVASFFYYRSLDALEFGNDFAAITGVSVGRVRTGLILLSGALTAVATAWCGPIAFIGMVVPHVARMLTGGGSHLVLIPATALSGALVGLACQILSVLPSMSHGSAVPVNAITPVFGVPLILYVLLRRMKTFGYAE
ncbi:MAG: iron ABC transporter permease, partial [Muribaculaceae bacterium]|nr:iron ABC transporter permease [Muribaculaceae bacterium]